MTSFEHTLDNKNWLKTRYVDHRMSARAIADEVGCSTGPVYTRLRLFGIPLSSTKSRSHSPRPKKCRDTLHNSSWMGHHYINLGWNCSEIARHLGVSVPSVIWALNKHGIRVKHISEAKTGKRVRKQRTLGPCVVCGGSAGEVNHKDRNHGNNHPSNLEYLCRSCHSTQHRIEERMAIDLLEKVSGTAILELHEAARERLLEQKGRRSCEVCGKDGNKVPKNGYSSKRGVYYLCYEHESKLTQHVKSTLERKIEHNSPDIGVPSDFSNVELARLANARLKVVQDNTLRGMKNKERSSV